MTPKEKLQKRIERIERMQALRSEGKTYEEIGKEYGISRQRAAVIIKNKSVKKGYTVTEKQCVYKGLRDYLQEQGMSVNGLAKMLYGDSYSSHYTSVAYALSGKNCNKRLIDKVLKATGLSYEVAFGRSDTK